MKNSVGRLLETKGNVVQYMLLLLCFCSLKSHAQETIKVVNSSGDGVIGAQIHLNTGEVYEVNDSSGLVTVDSDFDSLLIDRTVYPAIWRSKETILKNDGYVTLGQSFDLSEVFIFRSHEIDVDEMNVFNADVISSDEIMEKVPATTADALESSGKLYVQRSQQGGGSPVIRGFEANRILLVVDGVRMNNAIYRGGHLQSVITVDPYILDEMEVTYGPGNTRYGSDALGGVVHMKTRNPKFSKDSILLVEASSVMKYASVNKEKRWHLDFNIGGQKLASLTSLSFVDFEDLRSGKNANPFDDYKWIKMYNAVTVNGEDQLEANGDGLTQTSSAYRQYDFLQKFAFYTGHNHKHTFNFQLSNSSDIPRFDRLALTTTGDSLKHSEWYYGPQTRFLAAYRFDLLKKRYWYDKASINLSYQKIKESRNTRQFGDPWRTERSEHLEIIGLNLGFHKKIKDVHAFEYGFESYNNLVFSDARNVNVVNGQVVGASTRYPDGGSIWRNSGIYLKHVYKLAEGHHLADGIRLNNVALSSRFIDTNYFPLPVSTLEQSNSAITGQLGLNSFFKNGINTLVQVSTGFRAPNVDDVGKVFDSNPGNVIVPNSELASEYIVSTEFDVHKTWNEKLILNSGVYYSWVTNLIQVGDASFNGQDSILYDGVLSKVQSSQNIGSGRIYGAFVDMKFRPTKSIELFFNTTMTKGRDVKNNIALSHIPPLFGKVGAAWESKMVKIDINALYNGRKDLSEYGPGGTDKLIYATPNGTPAWFIVNSHVTLRPKKQWEVALWANNVLDVHYRAFASGINAPGRSLSVTVIAKL